MSLRLKSLSKSPLFFAPLLLLPYSLNSQALSAQTSSVIQGTAPYLTFDGGTTKVMSVEGLLGIKLPNGFYIPSGINSPLYPNAIIDTSSADNPIEMPNITDTFASIQTMVPIENYPEISLSDLVNLPYKYGRDDDGDTGISATGNLTIKWQDKNGKDITEYVKANPNRKLNFCDAPYRLTLITTDGNLSTQYGIPNTSSFTGNNHSYYINPNKDEPRACYAQPNLYVDNLGFGDTSRDFDGPDWVANKGFKIINAINPAKNFPTTGSNNLRFYLLLAGITPEQVLAANGDTVYAENGSGVTLSLSKESTPRWEDVNGIPAYSGGEAALKIVLKGPISNSNNNAFTPSLFKLYSDSSHTKLLYSFKIGRWYIAKPNNEVVGYENARRFCQNLGNGYRLPYIKDYTNANGNDWTDGIPGRNINFAQRRVSLKNSSDWDGGLFNEWGTIRNSRGSYPDSEWGVFYYWTSQSYGSNQQFDVSSLDGYIIHTVLDDPYIYTACVTP